MKTRSFFLQAEISIDRADTTLRTYYCLALLTL